MSIFSIRMSKVGIILDTNFLMIPGQFGVDIFDEIHKAVDFHYQLYACTGTIKELEKLTLEGKMSDRSAAKLALKLLVAKGVKTIVTDDRHVDDVLVELSQNENYLIATQDIGLRKRLKSCLYLRQKKYVEIKGK